MVTQSRKLDALAVETAQGMAALDPRDRRQGQSRSAPTPSGERFWPSGRAVGGTRPPLEHAQVVRWRTCRASGSGVFASIQRRTSDMPWAKRVGPARIGVPTWKACCARERDFPAAATSRWNPGPSAGVLCSGDAPGCRVDPGRLEAIGTLSAPGLALFDRGRVGILRGETPRPYRAGLRCGSDGLRGESMAGTRRGARFPSS